MIMQKAQLHQNFLTISACTSGKHIVVVSIACEGSQYRVLQEHNQRRHAEA